MTILHLEDWKKYPNAIIDTRRESWVKLSSQYREEGIQNHAFFLALLNPELKDVDPFDPMLTDEQKAMIVIESRDNPFYFWREVVRTWARHGTDLVSRLDADRGNIAMWWSFLVGLTVGLQQIRQTRKTVHTNAMLLWLSTVRLTNHNTCTMHTDGARAYSETLLLDEMAAELPSYFLRFTRTEVRDDDDNTAIFLSCPELGNLVFPYKPQMSEKRALNQGRGITTSVLVFHDLPYQINAHISMPTIAAATGAATQAAISRGEPYGVIISTSAGKKSTKEGKFVYDTFQSFCLWSDTLFDAGSREDVHFVVTTNASSQSPSVFIPINHRDLGLSDEWLRARIEESRMDGATAEREYFNQWTD